MPSITLLTLSKPISFNTTTFLLNSWASLQSCLPMSLWYELTALYCFDGSQISCEIHVGRQCSYRCSYKMILRRKHAVHQSMTPFQTERYSRPRHLAASFPFPAHAKSIKTPLPSRPIHWRTLYLNLIQQCLLVLTVVDYQKCKPQQTLWHQWHVKDYDDMIISNLLCNLTPILCCV